ncbi:DUF4440 domain-containing protein [Metabacillus sp. Hm71]|uniref:DUF4440 domain-containing protein n=1 Tax=Metabacillus sp. Hm71 TaxID=3450743 RepID=UPI003F42C999
MTSIEQSLLEEHILHLEKQLMTNGHRVFNEYLADDFLEFGSSGTTYDKKAQLDAVSNKTTINSIKITVTDFTIKLLASDVVLATYRTFVHHNSKYALRSSI